jgi:hypothetical protein
MATLTYKLCLLGHAFAVKAAEFRSVSRDAGAGFIRAFPRLGHNFSFGDSVRWSADRKHTNFDGFDAEKRRRDGSREWFDFSSELPVAESGENEAANKRGYGKLRQ